MDINAQQQYLEEVGRDTNEIGSVQVDFVAHCGGSTGGDYIHTTSAVDIATHWWEGKAIAVAAGSQRGSEPDPGSGTLSDSGTASGQRFAAGERSAGWTWTHMRKVVGRRNDPFSPLRLAVVSLQTHPWPTGYRISWQRHKSET